MLLTRRFISRFFVALFSTLAATAAHAGTIFTGQASSPVTPYYFIEFQGIGTLKGIKGNKADYGAACFSARAEDRNEPGGNGQSDGVGRDRYFIRVVDCTSGVTLLYVDENGTPETVDPVTITGGNLQIHASSCTP